MSPMFQNSLAINYKNNEKENKAKGGRNEERRICLSCSINCIGRREV